MEWGQLDKLPMGELKNLGHKLLDEYISLDVMRQGSWAKHHAYRKLGKKLKREEYLAHFRFMTEKKQVVEAIAKLRKMIDKRRSKIEWRGKDEFAPNLMELQRSLKPKVLDTSV